jgi:ABC-type branched-subunit amino acid transport system ATPase component
MDELVDEIAATFPRLKERLAQEATSLSGGEQQMLAIARAMMARPRMILLDEPSEGIMPVLVDEMFELFARMKAAGTTILLVEQNVERALSISDRAYILDQGRVVHPARRRPAGRRRHPEPLLRGVSSKAGSSRTTPRSTTSQPRRCSSPRTV